MLALQKSDYQPRHAKRVQVNQFSLASRDYVLAARLDRMREDLMSRNFREGHRRGAINWFAYCLALRDVAALLRGEL